MINCPPIETAACTSFKGQPTKCLSILKAFVYDQIVMWAWLCTSFCFLSACLMSPGPCRETPTEKRSEAKRLCIDCCDVKSLHLCSPLTTNSSQYPTKVIYFWLNTITVFFSKKHKWKRPPALELLLKRRAHQCNHLSLFFPCHCHWLSLCVSSVSSLGRQSKTTQLVH